jgi:hypothetical protein
MLIGIMVVWVVIKRMEGGVKFRGDVRYFLCLYYLCGLVNEVSLPKSGFASGVVYRPKWLLVEKMALAKRSFQ